MNVEWTNRAVSDLDEIEQYISLDSQFNAKRFIAKIIKKVDSISLHPKVGRRIPKANDDQLRETFLQNYHIIYRQLPDGIRVLFILNGARDISEEIRNLEE